MACLGFAAGVAWGADGDPDPGFNGGHPVIVTGVSGSVTRVQGVVRQADGKVVVVASTDSGDGSGSGVWLIERFMTNGQLDRSFGSGGKVRLNLGAFSTPSAVLVQPADQKIVVGGSAGTAGAEFVRLNTNGSPDSSFGGTGEVSLSRSGLSVIGTGGIARDASGNLYLVGSGDVNPPPHAVGFIASVTSGGVANGWATGGIVIPNTSSLGPFPSFSGVAVSASTIFFAGSVSSSAHVLRGLLGAVSASSGGLVSSFGSSGLFAMGQNTSLNGLLLASDGKLKATGYGIGSGPGSGALIASFNTSGPKPTDAGFGSGGRVIVGGKGSSPNSGNAITEVNGYLYVAATAVVTGGKTQVALVGVNEKTGALDTGLGSGGFRIYSLGAQSYATSIADPNGKVVVGGVFEGTTNALPEGLADVYDTSPPSPPAEKLIVTKNVVAGDLISATPDKYDYDHPVVFKITVTNPNEVKVTRVNILDAFSVAGKPASVSDLEGVAGCQLTPKNEALWFECSNVTLAADHTDIINVSATYNGSLVGGRGNSVLANHGRTLSNQTVPEGRASVAFEIGHAKTG
jgi:uncharacterized delta-60 repeat protein